MRIMLNQRLQHDRDAGDRVDDGLPTQLQRRLSIKGIQIRAFTVAVKGNWLVQLSM